jgi:hypothetical protein
LEVPEAVQGLPVRGRGASSGNEGAPPAALADHELLSDGAAGAIGDHHRDGKGDCGHRAG